MKKVVFVCTGNTCRSPMAEVYLKSKKSTGFDIISRGLSADGSPASAHSILVMAELGLDLTAHTSSQFNYPEADSADVIVCMSSSHADLLEALGIDKLKIHVLGISDPYGLGIEDYRKCRDEIIAAIDEFIGDGIL